MGTGKSTVGQELAERLGCPFLDLDLEIEKSAGKAIPDIFADEGEDGFRIRETLALQTQVHRPGPKVVSCGGGVVLREENRELLHKQPHVFCLRAKPETLLARIGNDPDRPLLQTDDPAARLQTLLGDRAPLYAEFARQIDTDDFRSSEVVDHILSELRKTGE